MKSVLTIIAFCFVIAHTQNALISPSFADIVYFFSSTPELLNLSNVSFALGVSVGGLIFGSLSDSIGRKKSLLCGLAFIFIGCLLMISAKNIHFLILYRFIQGFGNSAPTVLSIVMIFDHFKIKIARKIVGYQNGVLTLGKSIAPVLGGYVNILFGWKANYIIIACFTVACIISVVLFLKPSIKHTTNNSVLSNVLNSVNHLKSLLSDKLFVGYAVSVGLILSSILTYTLCSSILFINKLGVEKSLYGYYQAAIWCSYGIFNLLNHLIVIHLGLIKVRICGFVMITLGIVTMNIASHLFTHPIFITGGMVLFSIGAALIIPILVTNAMSLHSSIKGSSSSAIAFIRTILISANIAAFNLFGAKSIISLTTIISVLFVFTICIYIFIIRKADKM